MKNTTVLVVQKILFLHHFKIANMHKLFIKVFLFCLSLSVYHAKGQSVGIGTTTPDPLAKLDIVDSTKGINTTTHRKTKANNCKPTTWFNFISNQ
jgi:hypothetical protein